ncbi:MAG: hypothetical protein K6C14_05440, partial [Eubacterium sp.]|nr:hypothetical protein [Eubacterium sp.]
MKTKTKKSLLLFVLSMLTLTLCIAFGALTAQAKTITIIDPEDMKNINWVNAGFGPGNTYKLGADMTLGENDDSTVVLTKGNFVIDLNGHTLQNATQNLTVIHVKGANVTLKDSKATNNKPSVRSYGAGAVQITSGRLEIVNGNYVGASTGYNNPSALHVGGGTCVVNGGFFYGEHIGANCSYQGKLYINGGTFQTGYMFALGDATGGGTIKISRANFISGTTTYGGHFALGAYCGQNYYNFNNWLALGSSFSPSFQTLYWNMQSSISEYPTISNYYAVAWETPTLSVTSTVKAPAATAIKKVTSGKKQLKITYKKKSCTGYQIQLATNKKFTKNVKTVTVKGKKNTARTVKKLKAGKKYFVRV